MIQYIALGPTFVALQRNRSPFFAICFTANFVFIHPTKPYVEHVDFVNVMSVQQTDRLRGYPSGIIRCLAFNQTRLAP
jgi:hypothetical protein